jgi:hypothetical protein
VYTNDISFEFLLIGEAQLKQKHSPSFSHFIGRQFPELSLKYNKRRGTNRQTSIETINKNTKIIIRLDNPSSLWGGSRTRGGGNPFRAAKSKSWHLSRKLKKTETLLLFASL